MSDANAWGDAIQCIAQCVEYVDEGNTKKLRKTLKHICGLPILEDTKADNENAYDAMQQSISETIDCVVAFCQAPNPADRAEKAVPLKESLETMRINFESMVTSPGEYENLQHDFNPGDSSTDDEATDEEDDVDAVLASTPSYSTGMHRRQTLIQTLNTTSDLGPEMTARVQGVTELLEDLFQAAVAGNVPEIDMKLLELRKQLVVIEKFLGRSSEQTDEEKTAILAVRDSCISLGTFLRDMSDTDGCGHIMDSIINLNIVVQELFAVMQRTKFLSTVRGSPSLPFLTRLQKLLDDASVPSPVDEEVGFLECKHLLLVAHDSVIVSCQRLTACLLASVPRHWKMVSACDQLVHSVIGLVRVSDKLHFNKASPNRRILYEITQVVINGIGLLLEMKAGESRSEFHSAINSLHVYIPALMAATDKITDDCAALIDSTTLKELTQDELDLDIDAFTNLEITEKAVAEDTDADGVEGGDEDGFSLSKDVRRLEVAIYLCTEGFKTRDDVTLPIGRVLTLPKVDADITVANLKSVLSRRYTIPPAENLIFLLATEATADSTTLQELSGDADRIQLFLYDKSAKTFNLESELINLGNGRYPRASLAKFASPQERSLNQSSDDPSKMSIAARAAIMQDRAHWSKQSAFSIRRKRLVVPERSRQAKFITEGIMEKVGNTFKHWTTRWFVLLDDELLYFKEPTDRIPLALIQLENYKYCHRCKELSDERHFCLALVPQNPLERVYKFAAPNRNEQLRWLRKIDCALPGRRGYHERLELMRSVFVKFQENIALMNDDLFRASGNEQRIKQLAYSFAYSHKQFQYPDTTSPTDLVRLLKKLFETDVVGPFINPNTQGLLENVVGIGTSDKQVTSVALLLNSQMNHGLDYGALCDLFAFFEFILSQAGDREMMLSELSRSFGRPMFPFMADGSALIELIINNREKILTK